MDDIIRSTRLHPGRLLFCHAASLLLAFLQPRVKVMYGVALAAQGPSIGGSRVIGTRGSLRAANAKAAKDIQGAQSRRFSSTFDL